MLSPYRVLDFTDERGLLCGQILADLGADVIQVEPPDRSPARRTPPFSTDGTSLTWRAFGRNKRSIVVDPANNADRGWLVDLVRGTDFLVESSGPRVMAAFGLTYDEAAAINPALVYVSISAFGNAGPKSGYAATDLTVQAASGLMIAVGDADRPPLRLDHGHAWANASAEAAAFALVAHHERMRSGAGQHVDISAQQAVGVAACYAHFSALVNTTPTKRSGGGITVGPITVPTIFETLDGFVSLTFFFGPSQGPFARRLMEWMCEEGECDEATRDKDWIGYLGLLLSGAEPLSELDRVVGLIRTFLRTRTSEAVFAEARRRVFMVAPVRTVADMLDDPQLVARDFWVDDGAVTVPGPFARFSAKPIRYRRPAPELGQHTDEVLREPARVRAVAEPAAAPVRPLDDVKVLDFMWLMAGPLSTRGLADFGATVIKIEHPRRVDGTRVLPPFIDGRLDQEFGSPFQTLNAGKRSLAVDPGTPEGKAVILDLVRWADVVTESYSPRALRNWGLDYPALRAHKPSIVMLSSTLFGQDGPYAELPGVGTMGSALAGLIRPVGWPDRPPTGPWGPYTDAIAPRFTLAAILAALDHRDRTGEGQYIDLSQIEASIGFSGPRILEHLVNGAAVGRSGNDHPTMAPHAVYPAAGADQWIAIAVRGDDEWQRLCAVIDRPDLGAHPSLMTAAGRRAALGAIDDAIATWTRGRSTVEIEGRLQQADVAAHAVLDADGWAHDSQLAHRGHVVTVPHSLHGTTVVESTHAVLSRTAAHVARAAPVLGEDTDWVLHEVLGYSNERVAQLRDCGAVPTTGGVPS